MKGPELDTTTSWTELLQKKFAALNIIQCTQKKNSEIWIKSQVIEVYWSIISYFKQKLKVL